MTSLPPPLLNILAYASRSPSGHNTQPWKVRVLASKEILVRSEDARWLPEVDPTNRELLLSLGA